MKSRGWIGYFWLSPTIGVVIPVILFLAAHGITAGLRELLTEVHLLLLLCFFAAGSIAQSIYYYAHKDF